MKIGSSWVLTHALLFNQVELLDVISVGLAQTMEILGIEAKDAN